jgi:hypothetical protein
MDELVKLAECAEAADDNSDALLFMEAFEAIFGGRKSLGLQWSKFCAMLDAEAHESAVLMLLPDRWKLRQMNFSAPCADDRKWHLNLHGGREGEDTFVGRASTPALALLAAICRAKAGA